MFPTREDFHYSIEVIEAFEGVFKLEDIQPTIAEDYARDVFEDFEKMSKNDREKVIEMIMEDMSEHYYTIS